MSEITNRISDKRTLRNDVILIAVLLLAATAAYFLCRMSAESGAYAEVIVDGEQIAVYPLDGDTETRVETGRGYNVIVIRDGRARVTEADCPDGICVGHRDVSLDGETIVCLPHRLVLQIVSRGDTDIK